MSDNTIARLGSTYHEWVKAHPDAADDFQKAIEDTLSDAGINYDRVVARVKSWKSLKHKARKTTDKGAPVYPDPWSDIHDKIGVRITVLHSTDIPVVLDILAHSFDVIRSIDKALETKVSGGFGYGSHHLVVTVNEESEGLQDYVGIDFEIQVRTVLQHAWAEFEHDIRYKRGQGDIDPQVDRSFTLAAGLIELADQQFDQIAALHDPETLRPTDEEVELTAETLPGILAMLVGTRFPRSRFEHYRWLEELLVLNNITTVSQLTDLLNEADIEAVSSAMNYRFVPGQVRIIDDLLLNRFGREHIERTAKTGTNPAQRKERLKRRLKLLRSAGKSSLSD
ncbi:GTP pyrophosphokinase family protein [Corynebacterium breve]|uniref:GTP pyrophosphokinase family protein n=1 Tax=Corynebacterium breve TaxID=3049799 RepID=A0ABY8VBY6_9CORY|nr:GTP pyrophosphokinase family protein [Corynebacterium breve]WIM66944.1 GTP pyrophosphokinase family protein [Corynebacterium breve]